MVGRPSEPKSATVGIVGGYGQTGTVVVAALVKRGNHQLRIGGRDLNKAASLAAQHGARAHAVEVDVQDARSLDQFCSACSIIVNCAGPVMLVQDRVAQAALRQRRHYVDVAALAVVKQSMLPHAHEMAGLGLSCVVSAGWLPGLTELLPVYAHARAATRMDSIDALTEYFGDSGEWSANAYRDVAWYLRQSGLPAPIHFRRGQPVPASLQERSRKVDLGSPVGVRRFNLFSMPEFQEVGRRLDDCDVSAYTYLPGVRAGVAAALAAMLPMSNERAARLLSNAIRGNSLGLGGFVVVEVRGRSQGRQLNLSLQMIYDRHCEYSINGLVPAITVRMILEGRCVPGVNYLASAVDPAAFAAELLSAGIAVNERWAEPL